MRCFKKRLTLIEGLLIVAIISVFVALLVPPVKWASSGNIRLPVKIVVFDAVNRRPIPNADCQVFRSSPMFDPNTREEDFSNNLPFNELAVEFRGITDAMGISVIEYEFRTSANHERPNPHAHLSYAWVKVEAAGFGGVVMPVRYEGRPTAELKKVGQILITIGLTPIK